MYIRFKVNLGNGECASIKYAFPSTVELLYYEKNIGKKKCTIIPTDSYNFEIRFDDGSGFLYNKKDGIIKPKEYNKFYVECINQIFNKKIIKINEEIFDINLFNFFLNLKKKSDLNKFISFLPFINDGYLANNNSYYSSNEIKKFFSKIRTLNDTFNECKINVSEWTRDKNNNNDDIWYKEYSFFYKTQKSTQSYKLVYKNNVFTLFENDKKIDISNTNDKFIKEIILKNIDEIVKLDALSPNNYIDNMGYYVGPLTQNIIKRKKSYFDRKKKQKLKDWLYAISNYMYNDIYSENIYKYNKNILSKCFLNEKNILDDSILDRLRSGINTIDIGNHIQEQDFFRETWMEDVYNFAVDISTKISGIDSYEAKIIYDFMKNYSNDYTLNNDYKVDRKLYKKLSTDIANIDDYTIKYEQYKDCYTKILSFNFIYTKIIDMFSKKYEQFMPTPSPLCNKIKDLSETYFLKDNKNYKKNDNSIVNFIEKLNFRINKNIFHTHIYNKNPNNEFSNKDVSSENRNISKSVIGHLRNHL